MRNIKKNGILKGINNYLVDSAQPCNISYLWNFGSLLGLCLIIQIATGVTLAMHYNPSVLEAFNSLEHIMRDVNNGWLIRYLHSNTASAFFFLVYLHIGRGMYYGSYKAPRTIVWVVGTIILILMMATAFLGYVLPYGQMSLWGATVITNLMSAIPWLGQDIVEFIWGGFSVNNATLNRFFALHFLLPFVLAALVLIHLIALHDSAGSNNPLGVSGNYDRIPFAPYFIFKDLITVFLFIMVLSLFVFFMPNVLGDSENYVMANPMQTPPAIVPEWYLLPFYAILRSIPNKLLGVIAMFAAIIMLLTLPFTDLGRGRSTQFKPLAKIGFFVFVANFLLLMILGAKHVESPFIELGQISTAIYFSYFLIFIPVINLTENTVYKLAISCDNFLTSIMSLFYNKKHLLQSTSFYIYIITFIINLIIYIISFIIKLAFIIFNNPPSDPTGSFLVIECQDIAEKWDNIKPWDYIIHPLKSGKDKGPGDVSEFIPDGDREGSPSPTPDLGPAPQPGISVVGNPRDEAEMAEMRRSARELAEGPTNDLERTQQELKTRVEAADLLEEYLETIEEKNGNRTEKLDNMVKRGGHEEYTKLSTDELKEEQRMLTKDCNTLVAQLQKQVKEHNEDNPENPVVYNHDNRIVEPVSDHNRHHLDNTDKPYSYYHGDNPGSPADSNHGEGPSNSKNENENKKDK